MVVAVCNRINGFSFREPTITRFTCGETEVFQPDDELPEDVRQFISGLARSVYWPTEPTITGNDVRVSGHESQNLVGLFLGKVIPGVEEFFGIPLRPEDLDIEWVALSGDPLVYKIPQDEMELVSDLLAQGFHWFVMVKAG